MSPLRGLIGSHARTLRAIIITVALLACGDSSSPVGPGGGGTGGGVGSIVISPTSPTVTLGGQLALQAQVKTASGNAISGATVFWSSADTNTVTISSGGIVTGKVVGTAEIAASSGGVSARVVVTVVSAPVASIAVAPTAATLVVGGTTVLQAVTSGADGTALTGRTIIWASSAPQVAAVDATGNVIGRSAGTTSITATSEGKTATSTITVTVIPVAAISIAPTSASLLVGASTSLTAIPTDANGNVLGGRPITWQSADSTIALVSDHGLVTAVGPGTVSITATAEGKTSTAQIVVTSAIPTPVGSVSVTPGSASIIIGGNSTLSATVRDANGTILNGRSVTWESSAPTIATVSSSGVVTAVSVGNATITATSEEQSGTASVTVSAVPVMSVTVSPATASIYVGATKPLTAVTKDAAGNVLAGRIVTWTSSAPNVATVDANGVVSGALAGTATITATSESKSATSVITVTLAPVASITLNPTSASLVVGSSTTIAAVLKDASNHVLTGRTIAWVSTTPGVATVNASGVVTAVSAGAATIKATSEGRSATSAITVSLVSVASVVLNPTSANLYVGGATTLSVVTKDASGNVLAGRTVDWTSSAPTVATVNAATGLITAVATGTATITAMSEGHAASASVVVSAVPVASVTVSPTSASLNVGATVTITAVTKNTGGGVLSGRTVSWTSSAPSVATVSASGVVTGVGTGIATITATSEGKSASSAITVSLSPVTSITLNPSSASLVVGSATRIGAVLKDANGSVLTGRTVAWVSNTPGVATVDATGLVNAVSAGTATITATSEGHSASSAITVSLVSVASVVLSPTSVNLYVDSTATLSAITKDANGNVLTGRVVTWTSSAPAIATVNPTTGLVTAVATGVTTITGTSEGHHADASVVVTLVSVASVTIDQSPLTMETDSSVTLSATVRDGNGHILTGRSVAWQIDATSVATIGVTSGVLTTTGTTGTATITATSDGKSGTAPLTVGPAPVGTVVLSPPNVGLQVPATATIVATVKDSHNRTVTGRTINWTSSDPAVASVDGSGVITALAPGSSTVTATSEGKSGTTAVSVTDPVATVIVTAPTTSVARYGTLQLADTTKNGSGSVLTGRTVTWTSSTPAVATVNQSTGLVTGVSAGATAITATSEGIAGNSVTITVTQAPVATVTVAPSTASTQAGGTAQFTAAAKDSHGTPVTGPTITWSSDTPAVATVDANGLATAVAPGSANIKATSSDGPSGSAVLTVTAVPVASVTVAPPTASLIVGAATTITAVTKDAGGNVLVGRTITWTSNTPGVATVDANGTVTAVSAGTATITAASEGQSGTSVVTVTLPPVATVTLNPTSASLIVGSATTIAAVLKDANDNVLTGRTVTWESNTPGVAAVDANGTVTAVSAGAATITATSEGQSGTSAITVSLPPVATVTLNPTSASLVVGAATTITAVTKDADGNVLSGRTVTWTSNTPGVATVDANGGVTAVSAGAATITATSEGQSATATITVTLVPVASVELNPTSANLYVDSTTTFSAITKDADGNVLTGRVVGWTSSAPGVATIDATTGLVTAIAPGPATITATSEGQSADASVVVTLVPVASVDVTPATTTLSLAGTTTVTLTATPKDASSNALAGRTVTWASSDTGIATVDPDTGVVTAVAQGTVTITATSETIPGTATVTVDP